MRAALHGALADTLPQALLPDQEAHLTSGGALCAKNCAVRALCVHCVLSARVTA